MRRLALASAALMLAAMPAGAADAPIDVVRQLYAGHPHAEDPPGGWEIWMPHMQALWQRLIADERQRASGALDFMGEGLTFDFMTGTQEERFEGLKLKTLMQTEGEAEILASLNNGADAPYALHYGLAWDEIEGWAIAEVWREGHWRLSELIENTR
jgi:hypothetical protein